MHMNFAVLLGPNGQIIHRFPPPCEAIPRRIGFPLNIKNFTGCGGDTINLVAVGLDILFWAAIILALVIIVKRFVRKTRK
jgi:hypothetical protein